MLNVHICEDDEIQLRIHKRYIEEIISLENFDMEVACVTKDPYQLLECVGKSKNMGLYFLDVNLNSNIDGIDLAVEIRKLEPECHIIFITKYDEETPGYYMNRFNANYIIKEETTKIKKRMREYMVQINEKYQQSIPESENFFTFRIGHREISIHYKNIIFIRTSTKVHHLILYTNERKYEFYGQLKDVMNQLDSRFYMCHESYIINKEYIKENGVDFKNNVIYFVTGDICPMSVRKRKGLERYKRYDKKKEVI